MISCEYYEIFKNTYFEEHLETAASTYNKLVYLGSEVYFKYFDYDCLVQIARFHEYPVNCRNQSKRTAGRNQI